MSGRRVCLLTGAGGQLGSAFCRRYASHYDLAAIWSRRPPVFATEDQYVFDPLGEESVLPENANPIMAVRADITKNEGVVRAVDRVLSHYGRIDLVVHAAGFRHWSPMFASEALLGSFDRHFDVNVRAPLSLTIEVAKRFWIGRTDENIAVNRNVIAISSIAGVQAYFGHGQSLYAASKAALNHMTRHLASELQLHGVRANALAPNTFPGIVPTYVVADAIVRLDRATTSGGILVLDAQTEYWI